MKKVTKTTSQGKFLLNDSATSKTFYKQNGAKQEAIDLGGSKVMISIPTFLTVLVSCVVFVGGIVWFIAGSWVFSNKCENLKSDIIENYINKIKEKNGDFIDKDTFNKTEDQINKIKVNLDCLKNKNYFSADCFK